ncbi:MAG: 4'-phosphopantetheinyl transferase superfamily protein [Sulfitobacter sp.]
MTFSDKTVFLSAPTTLDLNDSNSVLLLATFDINRFDNGLYDQFQIDKPDTLSKAVNKRQAEYLAGRALVQHAFEHLKVDQVQLPMGQDRAPIWPPGIHGSISHTKGRVACLLTKRPGHFVGIDIEKNLSENGLKSVKQVTLQPSERDFVAQYTELPEPQLAGAIFSAKETLFKALYPIVQRFFGFNAAACIGVNDTTLRMELTQDLHATLPIGRAFEVQMRLYDGHVLTWLLHDTTQ